MLQLCSKLRGRAGGMTDPSGMARPRQEGGQKLKQGRLGGLGMTATVMSIPQSLPRLWLLLSQLR